MDADLEGGIVLNALHGQNGSRDSAITTGYEASVSLNVMIGEDYMQRNPLLDHIERKYPRGLRLMKFTGCYWPISGFHRQKKFSGRQNEKCFENRQISNYVPCFKFDHIILKK